MMLLSQASQILGGKLVGRDVMFSAVSSDSRAITAGDLFVALQRGSLSNFSHIGCHSGCG